jgi:hypothetical protein
VRKIGAQRGQVAAFFRGCTLVGQRGPRVVTGPLVAYRPLFFFYFDLIFFTNKRSFSIFEENLVAWYKNVRHK